MTTERKRFWKITLVVLVVISILSCLVIWTYLVYKERGQNQLEYQSKIQNLFDGQSMTLNDFERLVENDEINISRSIEIWCFRHGFKSPEVRGEMKALIMKKISEKYAELQNMPITLDLPSTLPNLSTESSPLESIKPTS